MKEILSIVFQNTLEVFLIINDDDEGSQLNKVHVHTVHVSTRCVIFSRSIADSFKTP